MDNGRPKLERQDENATQAPLASFTVAVLPGDGIGPEVTEQAVRVLRAVTDGVFEFRAEMFPVGGEAIRRYGSPLPRTTVEACLASDAVLLGAVGSPEFDRLPPAQRPEAGLLGLRTALGGFANLRPAVAHRALAGCSPLKPHVLEGADVLFVRELLGDVYFGEPRGYRKEGEQETAFNTMVYSTFEIERVARVAFDCARRRRSKVTSVDKANVLECSQLWRHVVSRVAEDYPDVTLEHQLVDSCAMRLATSPASFDVILTPNMFGDILSDQAAALTGSLGVLPSATIGGDVDLYEPIHGSAPDIAGRGTANPLGAISAAAMLLRHSAGRETEACAIEAAIGRVLDAGFRTSDIWREDGGSLVTTAQMGDRVLEAIAAVARRPAGA